MLILPLHNHKIIDGLKSYLDRDTKRIGVKHLLPLNYWLLITQQNIKTNNPPK